jgi:hypothetical protein
MRILAHRDASLQALTSVTKIIGAVRTAPPRIQSDNKPWLKLMKVDLRRSKIFGAPPTNQRTLSSAHKNQGHGATARLSQLGVSWETAGFVTCKAVMPGRGIKLGYDTFTCLLRAGFFPRAKVECLQ